VNITALLTVLVLLIAALTAGTVIARQARRLLSPQPPGPTGALPGGPASPYSEPDVSYRPVPNYPYPEKPQPAEDEAIYRAVTAALQAHSKTADRKALLSNLLFFTAGVLASILTTLLIHPL
jgi:hypothetical protein